MDEAEARHIHKNGESVEVRNRVAERAEENSKTCSKGETLLKVSSRRIKALVSIPATNLLDSCYNTMKEEAARKGPDLKFELSVEFTGTAENR